MVPPSFTGKGVRGLGSRAPPNTRLFPFPYGKGLGVRLQRTASKNKFVDSPTPLLSSRFLY
jgi:hypothetical protein